MKTNQILVRQMGEFNVLQRTNDGMFNATKLIEQWNNFSGQSKEVTKFFELKNTKEFINALMIEENYNTQESAYLKSRGKNGGTWMCPILFVKFAMWLNPAFEVKVIKWVYDQLILHRHKAGDNYRLLTASVSIFPSVDYPLLAKALNYIVFNRHHKDIRNTATETQMQELHELEEKMAFAVDMGFVRNFGELMHSLRKIYNEKNRKF